MEAIEVQSEKQALNDFAREQLSNNPEGMEVKEVQPEKQLLKVSAS